MSFIHLHVYSAYSLLSSTAMIGQLVASAKQKGFSALALTDRNVMYGTIAFYKECLKQGMKPIIGLTVDVLSEQSAKEAFPLVLLAKNNIGFDHLLKITSVVQTKSKEGIPVKWLKAYSEGLFAITPGIEGEIEHCLEIGNYEEAKKIALQYEQIFEKGQFFLTLQNHQIEKENKIQTGMIQIAKETGIPLTVSNQVHYLEKEDAFAQECLVAVRDGVKLADEGFRRLESDEFYLKTADEITQLFKHHEEAIENTRRISEQCNVMLELHEQNLPKYPVEDHLSTDKLLEEICWSGFNERYKSRSEEHKKRLNYELEIIKKMKFSDYFLIVWDFMRFSRENGILTGPGRGSAAGSMVSYVLYITDVDPVEHKLLFERFLNPERISMPDIDIDFPDNRRDEVIKYVSEKYGALHVAQIITFGTLAAKSVLRDVGRTFGFSAQELDSLSRKIPSKLGMTLKNAFKESNSLRMFINESSTNRKLFDTALKLEGLPRHTSTHAAGVVISEKPLVNVIPIQSGHDDVYLTQYSMEHLEDVGLLKMDFLGLRNLTLIENILSSVHRQTRMELNIKSIPLDDEATFSLLGSGNTSGIFQLEADYVQRVLKRLRPTCFEDIVAVNALNRPGPMDNIPLFIERKHGKQKVEYPHPDLIPILESTYGVIVYQEQIMQIAAKMAGFSLGEADLLRRAVSKKQREALNQEREHFVNGSLKNGYDEKTANEIYDLIVRFANYGFNRSHAVAYSFISYQLAYLKAHYPLHFMAALLTSVNGNDEKIAQYVRELKQMNLTLLPPSINSSGYSFLVEKESIRYSLSAIKGVGLAALKEIFQARKQKRFMDLFDFCMRVSMKAVNRKTVEALVDSGSFDEFGEERNTLLTTLDAAIDHAQLIKPDDEQYEFFSDDSFFPKPKYTKAEPMPIEDKLAREKAALGLYLSDHPVSVFAENFSLLGAFPLYKWQPKKASTVAYISAMKKIRTKKGLPMAFLTLSDETDDMEAVVFPTVLSRFSNLLIQGNIVLINGKMEEREGKRQLIIQAVEDVKAAIKKMENQPPTLYLKIDKEKENTEILHALKNIFKQNDGHSQVIIYYESTQKTLRLGEEDMVNPTNDFMMELKKILGENNVILRR